MSIYFCLFVCFGCIIWYVELSRPGIESAFPAMEAQSLVVKLDHKESHIYFFLISITLGDFPEFIGDP